MRARRGAWGRWLVAGLGALALGAVWLGSGCDRSGAGSGAGASDGAEDGAGESSPGPGANDSFVRPGPAELILEMAALAGESLAPEDVLEWVSSMERGDRTMDDYIDHLLARPSFAEKVVPTLIFGSFVNIRNYYAFPSGFNLKETAEGVLYLREPCPVADAVAVRRWWDLGSEVKVCPDSYRPDKWVLEPGEHEYRSAMTLTCDSQVGSPEKESRPLCGCGPNLIRCLRDAEQYIEATEALMDEVRRTTAHVVREDMPISALFLMNETVRGPLAELHQRRRVVGATQDEDVAGVMAGLAEWPEEGTLAPRREVAPGEHAGLLTAAQILHFLPDRRQRQRGYYEILWCANRSSFGATTEQVLSLNKTGNLAFVHDSWKRLTETPLCTKCHARLDYGFQFSMGYPDSRASVHYIPDLALPGKGPLYGEDIDDPRGEGPLTPQGFAQLAVAQPEFKDCMSSHFVDYVLGERATARDVSLIRAEMDQSQSIKNTMGLALQLLVEHWHGDQPMASQRSSLPEGAPATRAAIEVTPALRQLLDEYCVACHDSVPFVDSSESFGKPFDFTPASLPRKLLVRMVDHVAYGKMPAESSDLPADKRLRMVELFIATLFADEGQRQRARIYYIDQLRALPSQQIDNAMDMVVFRAGGAAVRGDWGLYERSIYPDQAVASPGYMATIGLEALNACRTAGNRSAETRRACLRRALHLDMLLRWPLEDPAD